MSPKEKILAILIGGGLGAVILFQVVTYAFIDPLDDAAGSLKSADDKIAGYERTIKRSRDLKQNWFELASRTLSSEPAVAFNKFGKDLKRMAELHNLEKASFNPRGTGTIGVKTGITTVGYTISAEGRYDNVIGFLRELYATPYLCAIGKLSLSPSDDKNARNFVKIAQLVIETPVLPALNKKTRAAIKLSSDKIVKARDSLEEPPSDPARVGYEPEDAYAVLLGRNVFKRFVPPPMSLVSIDNQDWKDVLIKMSPIWENNPYGEQPILTVSRKSRKDGPQFKGDAVEVTAIYADGTTFGPRRFDSGTRLPWVLSVPVHSVPPAPDLIDLAVNNQHEESVDVVVTVTDAAGKARTLPTMRIPANKQIDIDTYEDVRSVAIAATYASGKARTQQTFMPKAGKQTYIVPQESAPDSVPDGVVAAVDAPPDANLTVTALTTTPLLHEMIARNSSNQQRLVISTGQNVDGGTLLAVHSFGGLVHMPETAHYYLYPFGRSFADRVLLVQLGEDPTLEEVSAAIEVAAEELATGSSQ